MTEAEWLESTGPIRLLEYMQGRARERKGRLFAAACCRRIWHLMAEQPSRAAVEAAERHADGEATRKKLSAASDAARGSAAYPVFTTRTIEGRSIHISPATVASSAATVVGFSAKTTAYHTVLLVRHVARSKSAFLAEWKAQASLARDLFGNPFRPVPLDRSWLQWNGGTIPTLAGAVYEERELPCGHLDVVRLALLADMMEDAGCTDLQILDHLRGGGPHVRGCWVVDLLLGKT